MKRRHRQPQLSQFWGKSEHLAELGALGYTEHIFRGNQNRLERATKDCVNRTLLIRHARLAGKDTDLLIENGRFTRIGAALDVSATRVLDAAGRIIVPPFYNCHTHAGMSLLRGYADDIELFSWLENHIWPAETRLTPEIVYHGTKLAILEMLRSGTVFFNDMYWYPEAAWHAVTEMGVRAALGRLFIEESPGRIMERNVVGNAALEKMQAAAAHERVLLTYAPHAVYTVSGPTLRRIAAQARADGGLIHIHAAETVKEVDDCRRATGQTPIAWLDECGVLGPRTILAHCVHLNADDIARIRDRGTTIVHMPCSNAKLASGHFDYRTVIAQGKCRLTIGTDGNASNNSLSMFGEMKLAALLAKLGAGDATCATDTEIWRAATRGGATAFGLDGGVIAEGALGDALLLDADNAALTPEHRLAANMVYAADASCVDTVICDGAVLMERRQVPGAAEIVSAARCSARRLAGLK